MKRVVTVPLGERAYDIWIGRGLGADALEGLAAPRRLLLVTDTHVAPLLADAWQARLTAWGARVTRSEVPAGEATKNMAVAARLCEEAARAGLDRRDLIVALGGGMVGDLAGFVAAIYLRGVRFIQIPTTLLAMVDSSVGGKTGVNLPQGKNLVGCFHQPIRVIADLAALDSLPAREFRSGLAEVVKYGVIADRALFERLESEADAVLARADDRLAAIVARSCELKAAVVCADEREGGLRAILNYGHTFGHALENAAGYGAWLHGEAVAVGMVFAAALSARVRGLAPDDAARQGALLARFGLPVRLAPGAAPWPAFRALMDADKKTVGGVPRFVLAPRLGTAEPGCVVGEADLTAAVAAIRPPAAAGDGG